MPRSSFRTATPPHRRTPGRVLTAAAAAVLLGAGAAHAAPHGDSAVVGGDCPVLHVFGVQGGEETSPDAATTSDTGALGQVFGPMLAAAGDLLTRSYIPYPDTGDGRTATYGTAATDSVAAQLETETAQLLNHCPHTRVAVAGYAHGAPAAARFANIVGAGHSEVPADRVAGIALLANPARAMGAPVFPGRPNTRTPASAPGAAAELTSTVTLTNPGVSGAGIDAAPQTTDFGALTGRVADLCVAGDATCDTTPGGPLARTVSHLLARTDQRDPVTAISTIAAALAGTLFTTGVEVINHDVAGTGLDQLSYQPTRSLGQRLADASAPGAIPAGPDQALAALFKLGTIGLGAVVSVARTVFTPATVAELAAIGLANPAAAVAALGTKVAAAVVELVPPQTALGWVNDAFTAVTGLITDQSELYTVAGAATYSSTNGRHGAYSTVATTPDGRAAFTATADWFTALTRDLAASGTSATTEPTSPARPITPAPLSGSSSTPPSGRGGGAP
ncbi:cutinase family protein [Nocardia rhamnosiphila]|uniref:cutinase family protein n=1 Tax=Nocardia rhamnosiphila TaxID=426716 RepID=UPI0033E5A42F